MRRLPDGNGGFVLADDTDLPVNMPLLLDRAAQALAGNDQFLALQSPTQGQAVGQVQALTRQASALIRLQTGQFDTAGGTQPSALAAPSGALTMRARVADRTRPALPFVPGAAGLTVAVLNVLGVL